MRVSANIRPAMEQTQPAGGKAAPPKDNIKETIESILVAFILAFVFRVFVVEAFVIPSGSMAPTLLGAHMRLRCQDCGYDFTVNYPVGSHDESVSLPARAGPVVVSRTTQDDDGGSDTTTRSQDTVFAMHCPNCGLKAPRETADPRQSATNPPVYFGDRILVLKYLYLIHPARRWDVVVFKSPSEPRSDFSVNYIKRLVGLPGETLMLLDGDVYTTLDTEGSTAARRWTVQTKPPHVQDALWRVVYDNDYYPLRANGRQWRFPWKQTFGSGWNTNPPGGPGRVLSFDNATGLGTITFDPEANPGTFPLTDWLAYDVTKPVPVSENDADVFPRGDHYELNAYGDERIARWNVSDLKVQFACPQVTGEGTLRVRLTKLGHEFTAEITAGGVSVHHKPPLGAVQLIGKAPLNARSKLLFVEFCNVDYRVSLRINGEERIASTRAQYAPEMGRLLALYEKMEKLRNERASVAEIRAVFPPPTVQIEAGRQSMQLKHLSLWRDIYYTPYYHDGYFRALDHGSPEQPVRLGSGSAGTGREYFVLGDNSIMSGDGRAWRNTVNLRAHEDLEVEAGRVPDRFLLGKAFFVYWPAGYRPFNPGGIGMTPNFGAMRMIH